MLMSGNSLAKPTVEKSSATAKVNILFMNYSADNLPLPTPRARSFISPFSRLKP
jgi:hypothetical protein